MAAQNGFRGFAYPDKGSRVLREWNEARQLRAALELRSRTQMRQSVRAGFAGAAVDRLTASLQTWSGALNADLDNGLVILRSRARGLTANSEFAKRFLTLVAQNIVGANGPALQVRAMNDGGAGLDKAANDAIETHWAKWGKVCDIGARMSLAHLLRVLIKGVARDGEALVRIVRNPKLPYGMALQALEADRLDETLNANLPDGAVVRMGVEVDSNLRPLAYHVKTRHPGEHFGHVGRIAVERVPARDMIHLFMVERAEQVRGYTWFHAVLIRAGMLHGFEEAAVVAARVGASKMGAFTRKEDGSGVPLANQLADMKDANGNLQMNAEPGEFLDLTGMPGVSLETWNPDYPHQNFESFLQTCLRGLASGLDVATHNLTGDMTQVNYSSARIAELSERDTWMLLQGWLISSALEPLFRDWLASALIRGEVTFPVSGKALPANKLMKFADASRFQGRRWQWVDPKNDMETAKGLIEARLASRTEIAASQGRDFDDIVDEQQAEEARIKEAGLAAITSATSPQPSPPKGGEGAKDKAITVNAPITVNLPEQKAAAVNVDARTTVNVPEQKAPEVKVDVAAPVVNVAPAQVVVQQPKRTVETIERDAEKEITRITREAQE